MSTFIGEKSALLEHRLTLSHPALLRLGKGIALSRFSKTPPKPTLVSGLECIPL